MKTLFLMLLPVLCMAQIHRPLPAVICMADDVNGAIVGVLPECKYEPDIHDRSVTMNAPIVPNSDVELLKKIGEIQENAKHFDIQNITLRRELETVKEQRRLEKKIAGIAGLLLFVSGNNDLKNIGLVSLFCYSIW